MVYHLISLCMCLLFVQYHLDILYDTHLVRLIERDEEMDVKNMLEECTINNYQCNYLCVPPSLTMYVLHVVVCVYLSLLFTRNRAVKTKQRRSAQAGDGLWATSYDTTVR